MATFVLGAIGSSIGGPVGGFIFATAGAVIDSYLFAKDQSVTGPRLDGIQVSRTGEGQPIEWIIGSKVRVPGQIIWKDTLEEVKIQEDIQAGPSGASAGTATSFQYFISLAIAVGEVTPGSSLYQTINRVRKVIADAKLIWDDGEVAKYDDITWYLGDQTTADPLMEGKLGAGNVPAYRTVVYCVIERLRLEDFGRRIPNLQFVAEHGNDVSVQDAIKLLVDRAGYESSLVDVSRIPYCFRGIGVTGPQPTNKVLETIGLIYGLIAREDGGTITFIPQGFEDTFTVPAGVVGTSRSPGYYLVDTPEMELPGSAEVRYVNWDTDAQPGMEPYVDPTRATADKLEMNAPVTLTAGEAQSVAKRMVWSARAERYEAEEFTLPSSYYGIAPGDVLAMPDGETLLVTETAMGSNYEFRVRGRSYDPRVYRQNAIGDIGGESGPIAYSPPETRLYIMEMNAPTPEGADAPGVFFGVRPEPADTQFIGASLYASLDDIDYASVGALANATKTGRVVSYTGITVDPLFKDEINEIVVEVDEATLLASASEAEVLAGTRNVLAMELPDGEYGRDWELLGYITVTALGDNRYRLTNLVRGLRGTEQLVNQHPIAGSRVVFVSERNFGIWRYDTSVYGEVDVYLKMPAEGGTLSEYAARRVRPDARNMLPYAPANVRYQVEYQGVSDYDVAFYWQDRSKATTEPFSTSVVASPDEPGRWTVRLTRWAGDVLYEGEVTETTFRFTQAMRDAAADVWTADSPFRFEVREISSIAGEGRAAVLEVLER